MPIHSGGDRPQEDDPMLQESLYSWTVATAQPDYHPDNGDDALASLVYEPVSALRARFSDDGKVDDISDHVTNMDIDTIAGYEKEALADDSSMLDGCPMEHDIYDDLHADLADATRDFCSSIFKSIPEPLLQRPSSPPTRASSSRARRPRRTMVPIRSSLRLAARASAVPVAQRAQQKLMRELDFVNSQTPMSDAAVIAFVDMYAGDLPEEAINVIKSAKRMGNKKLAKVLAAMAESNAVEMEVQ